MSGPPFRPGFVQVTSRLVVEPGVAPTDGAAGLAGCSSASVTLIVTAMLSAPPLPSETETVTA